MSEGAWSPELDGLLTAAAPALVEVRRDIHAHPELGGQERRTTQLILERLRAAGLDPHPLPGTGVICDVGPVDGPAVALRADLDGLPLADRKDVPYRSTVEGVCHACGHDVHTTVVLGAGLALAELHRHRPLPMRVRLVFQPAEECMPGGAIGVVAAGALDGVRRIFAVHCDPGLDCGEIGVSAGPITSASDSVWVRLHGPGGHTARPHRTVDLIAALGAVVTGVPVALSRRLDPRTATSLIWGLAQAGSVANAIPSEALLAGTLRTADRAAWLAVPELVTSLVEQAVAPYAAQVSVDYRRGVPPVINDEASAEVLAAAARAVIGPDAAVPTEQSLGGEDFAWYLERVPGAMARLGVRRPGDPNPPVDLHTGAFDVDERAIGVGARLLAATALASADR